MINARFLVPKLYLGTRMAAKFNLAGKEDLPKLSLGTRGIKLTADS
jgi:hypothetical protein